MPRGTHMKAKWANPEYRAKQGAHLGRASRVSAEKRAERGRVAIVCEECGTPFTVAKYRADNDRPRWCKKVCMRAWQRRQTGPKSAKMAGRDQEA